MIKLTAELPKWVTVPLTVIAIVAAIPVAYGLAKAHLSKGVALNVAKCSASQVFQKEQEGLARSKLMLACVEQENGWLENLSIRSWHDAVNAMPNSPVQFVGAWTSEQPGCEYQIELKETGEFSAEPVRCDISTEGYTGHWGVHDGKMVWLYDSGWRPWHFDLNRIDVVDNDFFLLTEQNGSRTRFRRVKSEEPATHAVERSIQTQATITAPEIAADIIRPLVQLRDIGAKPEVARGQKGALVDEKGRIDIWALQHDAEMLDKLPRGNSYRCTAVEKNYEEQRIAACEQVDGDAALCGKLLASKDAWEEQARSAQEKCDSEVASLETAYEQAAEAFNAVWLEPLKLAANNGDPVAEVVLRVCSTTEHLNRSGIDTDCSNDQAAALRAWHHLETIDFLPATGYLIHSDLRRMAHPSKTSLRPWTGQGPYSDEPVIAMLERQLDANRRGDLAAGDNMGYPCGRSGGRLERGTAGYSQCNYLYHMSMAMKNRAQWFFMAGDIYESDYGGAIGLTSLGLTRKAANPSMPFRTHNEENYPKLLDNYGIENTASFEVELQKNLKAMEENIAAYLRHEPRWAAFLMHREGQRLLVGARPVAVAN